jgi:dTMP kinase
MTPDHIERGLFLSLEGVDGAGKSGHITALVGFFEGAGRSVVVTREPGARPSPSSCGP